MLFEKSIRQIDPTLSFQGEDLKGYEANLSELAPCDPSPTAGDDTTGFFKSD